MSNHSGDSGFQRRVHSGHLGNFLRKLQAAETPEDLDKILATAKMAFERKMIESSQYRLVVAEYQQQKTIPRVNRESQE